MLCAVCVCVCFYVLNVNEKLKVCVNCSFVNHEKKEKKGGGGGRKYIYNRFITVNN